MHQHSHVSICKAEMRLSIEHLSYCLCVNDTSPLSAWVWNSLTVLQCPKALLLTTWESLSPCTPLYRNHVMRSDGVWLNRSVRTVTSTSMSTPCSFHMTPGGSSLGIHLYWVSHICSESVDHDPVLWIRCGSTIFKWHFVVVMYLMGLWLSC